MANTLRLLHLPAAVQQALLEGQLSEGHAWAILGLADAEAQRQVAQQVVAGASACARRRSWCAPAAPQPAGPRPGRPVDGGAWSWRTASGPPWGRRSASAAPGGGRLTIFYRRRAAAGPLRPPGRPPDED